MKNNYVLVSATKTLIQLGIDVENILWGSSDENIIQEASRIATEKGIPLEEFKRTFNEIHKDTAKLLVENYEKEKLEMWLANIDMKNAYENVEYFYTQQPFFYDRNNMFWFWNLQKTKYEMVDEVDLLNAISNRLRKSGHIIVAGLKNKYIESFKQIGREKFPLQPKKSWVQFKSKIFDIKTKEIFDATPEYFFTNPIDFEIGESEETPVMDSLFASWVGKEYLKTLYEIIAYCCYADYPIHCIFFLVGSGSNGKSTYLKLLNRFIGNENTCSTELDALLESRFESAKLYRKLVCLMGETNFSAISRTSLLKKLSGEDRVGFEFKNKLPFDDYNYAKLLIASNTLPQSLDTTDGFYRRCFVLDFPNQFKGSSDVLATIPEKEFNNLAKKVVTILPELLSDGRFTGQGSIADRKEKYILASNPLPKFIELCCDVGIENYCKYAEFYHAYIQYLEINKKRIMKMKAIKQMLLEDGFEVDRATKNSDMGWYVIGLKMKPDWNEKITKITKITELPLHIYENQSKWELGNLSNSSNSEKIPKETKVFFSFPTVYLKCNSCQNTNDIRLDDNLTPICQDCWLKSP